MTHGNIFKEVSNLNVSPKMSAEKLAIVTGGNKGIGYAIVQGLCEKYDGVVCFTSRDDARGSSAVKAFNKMGYNPVFHQLDITDDASVDKFKEYIRSTYGSIDVLINNAAIYTISGSPSEEARMVVKTNYFGTLRVCDALFPLLGQDSRVVNVSSDCGHLSHIPSKELRAKLSDPSLTVEGLSSLMNDFISSVENKTNKKKGWGSYAYHTSKVGLSALTRLQQRDFDGEKPGRNVHVNSVHPGWVRTDMTRHTGPLSIEEGAVAPLYLALGSHGLKGQYVWEDCSIVNWLAPSLPLL